MKIKKVNCERSYVNLNKPFKTALRTATFIEVINVTITLDNGIKGIGSATSTWKITGESLDSIEAAIMGPIKDVIINQNIQNLNDILLEVEACCIFNFSAKSAVDIALHDLYCKVYDIPLYVYLGGKKNSIQTDVTVSIDEPKVMRKEAIEYVKQGFQILKIKVGNNVKKDIQRISEIQQNIDSPISLRLDANQGWSGKEAINIIHEFENMDIHIEFIEQPVHMNNIDELKFVKDNVNIPIMADESVFSPIDAQQLINKEAVDFLNIKLMKSGGIRRARQIADIAEASNIKCMIGSMMESDLSVTAAAHLAYSHPNISFYDLDAPLWLDKEFIKGGMQFKNNEIYLSENPGLGFES